MSPFSCRFRFRFRFCFSCRFRFRFELGACADKGEQVEAAVGPLQGAVAPHHLGAPPYDVQLNGRPVEEGSGEVGPPEGGQRRHEGDNVEQVALEGGETEEVDG